MCIRDRVWALHLQGGRRRPGTTCARFRREPELSLIHISEPTRQAEISYAVFCLKNKPQTPRSTPLYSSAASDVYKRQGLGSSPARRPTAARNDLREVPTRTGTVSYTHLRAHETGRNLVCRLLLEK